MEQNTGRRHYFSVTLSEAYDLFTRAYEQLSGLARTVRGPSLSCSPGKVSVVGIDKLENERVFVLKFLQARVSSWTRRVFCAAYDAHATWSNELRPAFGEQHFFFEKVYGGLWGAKRLFVR